jgi:hypothetical protein
MNQANLPLPDRKAANSREIAKDRNESGNSANARNKAAVAANNRGAVSKADDKPCCSGLINGGR